MGWVGGFAVAVDADDRGLAEPRDDQREHNSDPGERPGRERGRPGTGTGDVREHSHFQRLPDHPAAVKGEGGGKWPNSQVVNEKDPSLRAKGREGACRNAERWMW